MSDEAESKYCGLESYCSSEKIGNPANVNLESEICSDASSVVKQNAPKKSVSQPERTKPSVGEFENVGSGLVSALESVNSFSLHHTRNGNDSDRLSSCYSQGNLLIKHSRLNNDIREHYADTTELNDLDIALCPDSLFDNEAGIDFSSDYLAFTDSVVFGTDGSSPIVFDGEDHMCNFFMGIDSHISSMNQNNRFCQKSHDDMEDVEVSSTTSMSSIFGRMLNIDFDEQIDFRDSSIMKVEPTAFLENEAHSQDKSSFTEDQVRKSAQFDTLPNSSATDVKESRYEMNLGNPGFSINSLSTCHNQQICLLGSQVQENNSSSQKHPGGCEVMEQKHPDSDPVSSGDNDGVAQQESVGHNKKIIKCSEQAIEVVAKSVHAKFFFTCSLNSFLLITFCNILLDRLIESLKP